MPTANLAPEGTVEKTLALVQNLPGPPGRYFYGKLKRRLTERSLHLFDEAVKALAPGDIAVDLGAHVGDITRRLADTGATVHAFEPDPTAFDLLTSNLAAYPNVTLHRAAAGDHDGRAVLHRIRLHNPNSGRPSRANSIVRRDRKMNLEDGVEVRMVDFARFLRELPRPARLVKVDIEGAEWAVLRAVLDRALDRFDAMFVETHERFDRSIVPEARRLQRFAAGLERPYLNLYWK